MFMFVVSKNYNIILFINIIAIVITVIVTDSLEISIVLSVVVSCREQWVAYVPWKTLFYSLNAAFTLLIMFSKKNFKALSTTCIMCKYSLHDLHIPCVNEYYV